MRSVFAFLCETTENEVSAFLDRVYPGQRTPWLSTVGGDPHLYIDFYRDAPIEFDPHDWADMLVQFGGKPPVGVIANVSGRRPGDQQALEFVTGLLTRFSGFAQDDYTTHLWSLDELHRHCHIKGHAFFDYNGWHNER